MSSELTLADIADGLENSRRMGNERDEPEGACYIQISDTLAKLMAQSLRRIHEAQCQTAP